MSTQCQHNVLLLLFSFAVADDSVSSTSVYLNNPKIQTDMQCEHPESGFCCSLTGIISLSNNSVIKFWEWVHCNDLLSSQYDSRPPSLLSPSGLLGGSTHLSLTECRPKTCDPGATPTEGGVTATHPGRRGQTCLSGQPLCCARCEQTDRLRFDQEPVEAPWEPTLRCHSHRVSERVHALGCSFTETPRRRREVMWGRWKPTVKGFDVLNMLRVGALDSGHHPKPTET